MTALPPGGPLSPGSALPPGPCPICGRESRPNVAPFCSVRCADVDLGNWLSDAYVVRADPEDEDDPREDAIRRPGQDGEP